jgi:hypothetical protein
MIGRYLVKMNTIDSIMDRSGLSSLFQACGRAGETMNLCLSFLRWDSTEKAIYNDWPDVKTAESVCMPMYPMSPKMGRQVAYGGCYYMSKACYLITKGHFSYTEEGADFLYEYNNMDDNSLANRFTTLLHKISGNQLTVQGEEFGVDELTADMTAQDIRHGATDEMAMNQYCVIMAIVARGNWDWKGDCLAFSYATKKLFLAFGGKAIGDWTDCRQLVTPPRLEEVYDQLSAEMVDKENHCVLIVIAWRPPSSCTTRMWSSTSQIALS